MQNNVQLEIDEVLLPEDRRSKRVAGKSILLIEPLCDGHRAVYVTRLAAGLAVRGARVHIATTESACKHLAFKNNLSENQHIKIHVFPDKLFEDLIKQQSTLGLIRREFVFRRAFGEIYRTIAVTNQIELVLVPYLDYCMHAVALLGSPFGKTPWAGIVMRPAFHYAASGIVASIGRMAFLKKYIFLHLMRHGKLKNVFSIDESLCAYMAHYYPSHSARLIYLPDPHAQLVKMSKSEAKRVLGVPVESCLIIVFGAISLRKGISNLLAATGEMDFQNVHILLAGKQSGDVESWLNRNHVAQKLFNENRLHVINDFLDESQQAVVFSAADIVWLGYLNHYAMSGVLVEAGCMGLPVIADECGLIGWYTKKYLLGIVVKSSDTPSVALAVKRLVINKEFAAECGNNGVRLFGKNTTEQFVHVVANCLL